jgi:hypothetical protein
MVRTQFHTFDLRVKYKLLSIRELMTKIHFHTFDPRVEVYSTKRMNLVHIP